MQIPGIYRGSSFMELLETEYRHLRPDVTKLAGILSERDYARKIALSGRDSAKTRVSEIMTPHVVCISSDSRVAAAMSIRTEKHIRHLVVRDSENLMSVISISISGRAR